MLAKHREGGCKRSKGVTGKQLTDSWKNKTPHPSNFSLGSEHRHPSPREQPDPNICSLFLQKMKKRNSPLCEVYSNGRGGRASS